MRTPMRLFTLALAAVPLAAAPLPASEREPGVLLLPGLIVADQAETGAAGARRAGPARAGEIDIPGVRQPRPLDAAAAARIAELETARDAAGADAPGAAFDPIAPLPGDATGPPRVDSGHPDPDWLSDAPPAP